MDDTTPVQITYRLAGTELTHWDNDFDLFCLWGDCLNLKQDNSVHALSYFSLCLKVLPTLQYLLQL